jgi:hypothetical protein
VVAAVAQGGIITFDCGPDPVTIEMLQTAKVVNNTGPMIVLDGGGLITLSGRDERRILYMNTCDPAQVWTTPHCQNQNHPQLTVQNLTFVDGNGSGLSPDGGGAIFVRGGRFKIVNSRFFRNVCETVGPDVAGGAVRTFSQYNGLPVYVTNSTFGGAPATATRAPTEVHWDQSVFRGPSSTASSATTPLLATAPTHNAAEPQAVATGERSPTTATR